MKIKIELAHQANSFIIKNMYPLYLHDLAEIHKTLPNKYGIFEEDEIKTLEEQYNIQQVWFDNPKELFPYLISVDDIPAGFCLIGSGRYVPKDIDFYVGETFLVRPFRSKAIATEAVIEIFKKHRGRWMLYTPSRDNNVRAQLFWKKTLGIYTEGDYTVRKQFIDNMSMLVFKFNNL